MSDLTADLLHVKALIAAQRLDDALRAIGPLRRNHPDVAEVWICQAEALRAAGHTVEALVASEKAVQLSPGSNQAADLHREIEFEYLVQRAREAEMARSTAAKRLADHGLDHWNVGHSTVSVTHGDHGEFTGVEQTGRSRNWLRLVAVIVVVAMAAAPTIVARLRVGSADNHAASKTSLSDRGSDRRPPELGADAPASELPSPVRPSSGGSWTFLNEVAGEPVRHDPCTAIHYKVRIGDGPTNAVDLVSESLARVSQATGLSFVYDGTTNEVPRKTEGADLKSDSPLIIAWASPTETDLFSELQTGASAEAVGVGGPILMRSSDGSEWYSGGFVVIRTDVPVGPGFGPGTSEGNVLMHELGHVVGLGHVDDANELMAPWTTEETRAGYGPGDLYGLWRLGASQGCL